MLNGVAGDLIGPWYGVLAALIAGIIRNTIGTGTIFLSFEEQNGFSTFSLGLRRPGFVE